MNTTTQILRITPIGDINVGKTSLIRQYIYNRFNENKIQGEEEENGSFRKILTIDNIQYLLDFINFENLGIDRIYTTPMLFNSTGYILIYSITSKESFNKLKSFRELILFVNDNKNNNNNIPILLIGSKSDLNSERKVSIDDGKKLAKSFNNCLFFETSSKSGENIDQALDTFFFTIPPALLKNSINKSNNKINCNIL